MSALHAVALVKLPLGGAIVVSMLATGAAGWLLDKLIFAPLRARHAPHLAPMIATIGVAICLHERHRRIFRRGKFAFSRQACCRPKA